MIFKNLDFQSWTKLSSTSRRFKCLGKHPMIIASLLEKRDCVPNAKKRTFAIKSGFHLTKLRFQTAAWTEEGLTEILIACPNLQKLDLMRGHQLVPVIPAYFSKMIHSPYAPGPVFGLKRKSPRLNDRKEGNIE